MIRISGNAAMAMRLAAVGIGSLTLVALLILAWRAPQFSVDSWSYYDLSRSIASGTYELHQLRQFRFDQAPVSVSFPPLYPLLLAATDVLLGTGPRSGLVLNGVLVIIIALQAEWIFGRFTNVRGAGVAAVLLLALTPGLGGEIFGARSIPLVIALALCIFLLLRRKRPGADLIAGFVAGLCVLARFDMLLFAIILAAYAFARNGLRVSSLLFPIGLFVGLSPWIVLSIAAHGTLFASDNGATALSVDPQAFVTDWFPAGGAPATLFEAPGEWFAKILSKLVLLVPNFLWAPHLFLGLALLGLTVIAVKHRHLLNLPRQTDDLRLALIFLLATFSNLPALIATGYFDARYFSLGFLVLLSGLLIPLLRKQATRNAAITVLSASLILSSFANLAYAGVTFERARQAAPMDLQDDDRRMFPCLAESEEFGAPVLFLDPDDSARISALTHARTSLLPANIASGRLPAAQRSEFLGQLDIRYMVGTQGAIEQTFPDEQIVAVPACGPTMFERLR